MQSKNKTACGNHDIEDSTGQFLLPFQFQGISKQTYMAAHEKLMNKMRRQIRLKNKQEIEKTGKRLYRLRKKYRQQFAA